MKNIRALGGYIHTASQRKGWFQQRVSWEVRADRRDRNGKEMPVEDLVQYAQRRGDFWSHRHTAESEEREVAEAARRAGRLTLGVAAATVPAELVAAAVGGGGGKGTPCGRGTTPMEKGAAERLRHGCFPCRACNSQCHWTRKSSRLSDESRAAMDAAKAERDQTSGFRGKGKGSGAARQAVGAVGTCAGTKTGPSHEDGPTTSDSQAEENSSGNEQGEDPPRRKIPPLDRMCWRGSSSPARKG